MNKYLRHKTKGTIYGWSENMAKSQNVEEVTEEQAYPDRFAPKIAKGRKARSGSVSRFTAKEIAEIVNPANTQRAIAEQFGISTGTVSHYRRQARRRPL
jgi:DNA-binding NarL/FixJ family response regulator